MFEKIRERFAAFRHLQRDGLPRKKAKSLEEVECLNCGNHFSGAYCPNCGQTATTRRITVKDTLKNIFAAFLGGDDIFFLTLRDLLWRPGYLIYDYIVGRRALYFRPIHMLVRLVAIYLLISLITGIHGAGISFDNQAVNERVHSATLISVLYGLATLLNNHVISALMTTFIFVWPFTLIFHRQKIQRPDGTRTALNLAELFFALIYFGCIRMLITFTNILCSNISLLEPIATLFDRKLSLFMAVWVFHQLYGISWWKSFVLTVCSVALGIVLMVLIGLLVYGITYGIDAVK